MNDIENWEILISIIFFLVLSAKSEFSVSALSGSVLFSISTCPHDTLHIS